MLLNDLIKCMDGYNLYKSYVGVCGWYMVCVNFYSHTIYKEFMLLCTLSCGFPFHMPCTVVLISCIQKFLQDMF